MQGGVTSAHAVGRSATAVKVLTGENFTLTLDLQRLSYLTCDLSVTCRTFDLHLFLYFPNRTCACKATPNKFSVSRPPPASSYSQL